MLRLILSKKFENLSNADVGDDDSGDVVDVGGVGGDTVWLHAKSNSVVHEV